MGPVGVILVAAGAILHFGVNAAVEGVNLSVIGVVLMVVGAIAIVAALVDGGFRGLGRRETYVVEERRRPEGYQEPPTRS